MTASSRRARKAAHRDFLADDGFVPGLKPRIHAGSAAEFLAKYDLEPEEPRSAKEPAVAYEQWKPVARRLLRGFVAGAIGEAGAARAAPQKRSSPRARPEEDAAAVAPATEATKVDLRRLADARRDLAAFEPANAQQRELAGLLRALVGYLKANHRSPRDAAERERWWRFFAAYRRALDFPELAGPRRLAAFETLMGLKAEDLFAVARKGRMAHRMPNKRSTLRSC